MMLLNCGVGEEKGIAKLLIDYVINNKNIIEEKMGTELNEK